MWFNNRGWLHTIFSKLVIAFLLVVTPLYGIGLLMNKQGEKSVRSEVMNSLQSRVNYYIQSLETDKQHMVSMMNQLAVDRDLYHLTYASEYMKINEWSDAVIRLENRMRWMKESSLYIESVSAHMLTIGRTISTKKSITDQLNEYHPYSEESEAIAERTFDYWDNRLFLGLNSPDSEVVQNKPPSFVLQIELNLPGLRKALKHAMDYEQSGAVLMNLRQQWEVANMSDEPQMAHLKAYLQQLDSQDHENIGTIVMEGEPYLIAYKYSGQLDSYLIMYVPQRQLFGQMNSYKELLWVLSLLSIIVILLYSYWINRLIRKPLKTLIRAFGKVEGGNMELASLPRSKDEFRYLFQHYNRMVERMRVLIHEVYEQTLRVQTAELKQLQSQINPHFLYNTYFILSQLASIDDNENVRRFSQHLGEYFQYITRSAANEVTLASEVNHTRTYVEIQSIRFLNRIQVEFPELPESCKDLLVPKLFLQPVIENAYQHGLESKRKNGEIAVGFELQTSKVIITIADNGETLTDEKLQQLDESLQRQGLDNEYSGLLNVHRRLQLMFNHHGGITVARSARGGLQVALHIPLSNEGGRRAHVPSIDR
ncbi:sensor histidine kinase [Paenibacillaceae bacterium]|nr:sensor histidine kinase [Paenibacillaceae bacterium]